MYNPVSTYRIQFHKGFNFNDFEQIIPYLVKLGVKTIYASPIFTSVPGSVHGYDGVDPLTINPEIGTIDQLYKISKQLKENNIGWLQDIVPNHMAYHQQNKWLMDVLENGPLSAYRDYFDSSLSDQLLFKGPIMIPFLGAELKDVINNGELKIEYHEGKYFFNYYGQLWPLKSGVNFDIEAVNNDKEQLNKIAGDQYYRLCSYQETSHLINFRRFFTVNSLICLNIQNDEVFKTFHQLIIELVRAGVFQGLRIDHIDGLYDPTKYLTQLRKNVGDDVYIVVEKILEKGERMPAWPIEGNTGYDFLALVNNLLTGTDNKEKFDNFYKSLLSPGAKGAAKQVFDKKSFILFNQMAGELENLTNLFFESDITNSKRAAKDEVRQAIAQFLIHCPDYRFYGNSFPLHKDETKAIKDILSSIKHKHKDLTHAVDLLDTAFCHSNNSKALHFYMRCMQFSGPLMAKGVEDTLMYTYNRFIGHNEVGDAPDAYSISAADFHVEMEKRQENWPLSLNGTSTHDTKRGEDVRARLNALPDVADEWLLAIAEWQHMNLALKQIGAPDANDEYFIYQTLAGAYPMPGEDEDNFGERLQQYLQKTMREAKQHSSWEKPNENYEAAVLKFANDLLDKRRPFWKSFTAFHQKLAGYGIINSLAQVLLKFTCPGVPDVYQGCEHWDFSLVDPDNRRPVDYKRRKSLINAQSSLTQLWDNKLNGGIKTWLTNLLMQERKTDPLVFTQGNYVPLQVKGKYAANIFAFARTYRQVIYVTVVPVNGSLITDWQDTSLIMPVNAPNHFKNIITGTEEKYSQEIAISDIFTIVPFALLKLSHPDNPRGSGILMSVTSLPNDFGIGDMGPGAKAFADMLNKANQKYWQLLPINPVDKRSQYSPYSTYSSMAGNVLLLSPQLLANDGLSDTEKGRIAATDKIDYKYVVNSKKAILDEAWQSFKALESKAYHDGYINFCKKEAFWLDDYALYVVLKQQHKNAPWYTWPEELKKRDKNSLAAFQQQNNDEIDKEKWLQYEFSKQWGSLKNYCNQLGIKLFGDLPFYVSYDSVDVWANPVLFSIDKDGNMIEVAGVPPDYFSKNGQLWGMPVFNWEELKKQNFDWWIQRINKNLERFDLLRLDHFRAFSSYWAVPAKETTAINGEWKLAPGEELFELLTKKLGKLPFVAEDLGDIDEKVYALRDKFNLPGMRVLQFAFGDEAGTSPHIPHNYTINSIAYTGTHDNNTTKGWYRTEADKATLKRIKSYTGTKVTEKKIAILFIREIMASVAKIAIIPMQDLLELDENCRMNVPGEAEENWQWRMENKDFDPTIIKRLKKVTQLYNRI